MPHAAFAPEGGTCFITFFLAIVVASETVLFPVFLLFPLLDFSLLSLVLHVRAFVSDRVGLVSRPYFPSYDYLRRLLVLFSSHPCLL